MSSPIADPASSDSDALAGPPNVVRRSVLRGFPGLMAKAGRGAFWPLADQGVVSLGNILTIFLLGRGLAKTDFGTFTLILEALFFLLSLNSGLITYPLTVKGAVADDQALRRLTTASLIFTLLLAVPVAIAAVVVSHVYHLLAIGLMASLALLAWEMQEVVRRALLSHFRYSQAIWGDGINYVGQAVVLVLLGRFAHLTLLNALAAMAITSILALAVQIAQVGLTAVHRAELFALAKDFWVRGRWIALTNLNGICLMFCGNWALGWSHGREQIADFAAIAALLKICNPIVQTLGNVLVPAAAKAQASGGIAAARRICIKIAGLAAIAISPLFLVFCLAPHWCLYLAFHGKYNGSIYDQGLRLLVGGNMVLFLTTAVTSFLNGVHRSRYTLYGQVAGSIAMFTVMLPMILAFGWIGFAAGGLFQVLIQLTVLLYLVRKVSNDTPDLTT